MVFTASLLFTSILLPPRSEPLPDELVAAWEKAGAEVGYLTQSEWSHVGFAPRTPTNAAEYRGAIPGFQIRAKTKIADLPAPSVPFGLYFEREATPATDAGLTQLGKFAHLRTLSLWNTQSRFLNPGCLHPIRASSGAGWGDFISLPLIHFEC